MKKILLLIPYLIFSYSIFGQTKAALASENATLKDSIKKLILIIEQEHNQVLVLRSKIEDIWKRIDVLYNTLPQVSDISKYRSALISGTEHSTSSTGGLQCIAITKENKRCSRKVESGSSYCWQHKKTYVSPTYKSSGGTVYVKGYYRKDGTYVRPHTRRAPRRK